MQKKSLFSINIFWESVKRSRYVMIIHTIVLLFATTLPAYMTWLDTRSSTSQWGETMYIAEYLTGFYDFMLFVIIGAVVMTVWSNFSYLFKSGSVKLYNALPYTRTCIYTSKFASSLVGVMVPVICVLVVNAYIYISLHISLVEDINMFALMGAVVLCYLTTLSVCAFAASVSGNGIAMLCMAGFSALWYMAGVVAILAYTEAWIPIFDVTVSDSIEYCFPPFLMAFSNVYAEIAVEWVVVSAGYIVGFFTLGLLCYNMRKSENTEKFIVFERMAAFVKYYISTVVALIYGALLGYIMGNVLLSAVAYVLIFVLMRCILQAIFEKNVRSLFGQLKKSLVIAVCSGVILFVGIYALARIVTITPLMYTEIEVRCDKFEVVLTQRDNINKTAKVFKSKDEGKSRMFITAKSLLPLVDVKLERFDIAGDEYEEYMNYIISCDEYAERMMDGAAEVGGRLFAGDGQVHSVNSYADGSTVTRRFYEVLKGDMLKYDYSTEKDSGVYAMFQPDFEDKSYTERYFNAIRIYNCYEDTIKWLENNTTFYNIKWKNLKLESWADGYELVYETADSEIIQKIIKSCGLNVHMKAGKLFVTVDGKTMAINCEGFSKEVKEIIGK